MKKLFWIVLLFSLGGCAGVLDKTHTLRHPDGRTTECLMPGVGPGLLAEPIGKAFYGKEFDECMAKAKGQGFIEEIKK